MIFTPLVVFGLMLLSSVDAELPLGGVLRATSMVTVTVPCSSTLSSSPSASSVAAFFSPPAIPSQDTSLITVSAVGSAIADLISFLNTGKPFPTHNTDVHDIVNQVGPLLDAASSALDNLDTPTFTLTKSETDTINSFLFSLQDAINDMQATGTPVPYAVASALKVLISALMNYAQITGTSGCAMPLAFSIATI
ncbi:hypothetical protein R3P38DRAFT_2953596 [Favolaschia claudopus]|uniref:Uncharacterized protein n=1 Tax=Favolaschia claudopus TaxID=2862362 RepID=A0AAW0BH44_9AGAR